MKFIEWWETLTWREQNLIGQHNARFVWDEAQKQTQQEPVECMCGICKLGKREWQGLTDEDEIPWDGVDAKSFARAIEAKLKEKNHAE